MVKFKIELQFKSSYRKNHSIDVRNPAGQVIHKRLEMLVYRRQYGFPVLYFQNGGETDFALASQK